MKRLRTVFLGCGWAGSVHMKNLAALPDRVELAAFCDANPQAAASMAEKFGMPGARVYAEFHEMFAEEQFDLISIALPPYAHTTAVELAAQRGAHIFIEKPVALTSEKAWQMVEAVEKAGVTTQVGFMYRFGAGVERMKHLLDSGEAGRAGLISARYFCNSLHTAWWRDKIKSGGQVLEQAIHLVDLMRYLMGEAAEVYSVQENIFHTDVPDYTVEDVSGTVVRFASGAVGVLYACNGAIPMRWEHDLRLVTHKITAEFSGANHASITYTGGPELKLETIESDEDVYAREVTDLLDAIDLGRPARTPIREGARTLDLVLAANRSAVNHLPEKVN